MQISLKFFLNPPQLEVLSLFLFSVLAIDQNRRPPGGRLKCPLRIPPDPRWLTGEEVGGCLG